MRDPITARTRTGSAGLARVFVGFALGAVVAYFALSYADRHSDSQRADRASSTNGASDAPRMASGLRMSYELARVPEEATLSKQTTSPASPGGSERSAQTGPVSGPPEPGERVLNARPITSVPPDPRDTTREIGKEAQTARSKGQQAAAPGGSTQPGKRNVEGREVQLSSDPAETPSPPRRNMQKKAATPPTATGATGSASSPNTGNGPSAAPGEPAPATLRPGANEGANLGSPNGAADIVELRLEATRTWLASSPVTTHTIQLLGTPGEAQLRNQFQFLAKVLDPNRLYVYRTAAQGKPVLTVVYGSFEDRRSAQDALSTLPPAAAAFQPVLRTVKGIRSELRQAGKEL